MRLRWWVFLSTIVAVLSFGALYYVVTHFWPHPEQIFALPQLLFLALWMVLLMSSAISVSAYANYRFAKPGWLQRDKVRLLRQGGWVGLLGGVLAYLQLVRALTPIVGLVLVVAFFLVELFFLTRE